MICGVNEATEKCFDRTGRVSALTIDDISVRCIAERYANRMGFARRIWSFARFARTAARVVADLSADLVFATSTPLTVGRPGMSGARRLGVPFVFEVRDLWPELPIALGVVQNPLLVWYARRMERTIYHAADRIIALAPGIKEGICRTGYPADSVEMIPNGSDLDLFTPTDDRTLDPRFGEPGDLKLVFTGAHGLANGLDAVLDAALELKKRDERGVRFAFIGQGGQRDRLIERSRREGTSAMISWVEPMPKAELAAVLPRFDVGMMILKNVPSFYYGTSPNKFFDYIAAGLPVLNNYPGWLADMITLNRCGVIVPPDDAKAFADAVVELRDRRDRLGQMKRDARLLAERQFARPMLADRFVAVLEEVHAAHGVR